MKVWNLACNLGYVFTKRGKKRNFPSHLKVCFFVYSIFLYQDWIFFHIWQINYEQTFSIVNDHRSPWNFWCFFRDSDGTKMTLSWIGLTISWCLYHSRYEVWHKCEGKIGLFGSTFGHLIYQNLDYEACMLDTWSQGMCQNSYYYQQNDWWEKTVFFFACQIMFFS